jgi:hypothetical protein
LNLTAFTFDVLVLHHYTPLFWSIVSEQCEAFMTDS